MERWKSISGYEGYYEVSSKGRVRSLDREVRFLNRNTREEQFRVVKGKLMSTPKASNGYPVTNLSKEGRSRTYNVHVLVADAFLGPRPEGHVVDHIDYDRGNPDVKNLEYIPHGENIRRGYRQRQRQRGAD